MLLSGAVEVAVEDLGGWFAICRCALDEWKDVKKQLLLQLQWKTSLTDLKHDKSQNGKLNTSPVSAWGFSVG